MTDQFDVIEAGERDGRRRWVGLVVVLALLLIPAISLLTSRDPVAEPAERRVAEPGAVDPAPAAPTPRRTRTPEPIRTITRVDAAPNLLTVPGTAKGDDEVLRVVFPDGARADVRYPAELALDEMGSRPFQGAWIDDRLREFVAPYGGEAEITRGGEPIRNYADNVTLWPRQAGSGMYGQVMLFSFGSWRLAMYDRGEGLTFDQRVDLAENLQGRVTEDGYLVLSAGGGVRLASPGDVVRNDPVGPQLWFGGGLGEMVALVPTPGCDEEAEAPDVIEVRGRPTDMVCRGDVLVAATGPESFRARAIDGIRVTMK
ncbi:hypothetical protein E1286_23475 [Nonomuraea terrae]|uniref:Uncharacterized protein n=1 Tax=Nonomuraea terrae TaxID=2530383 RepID=A0A4R4YKX5_9ACTN|nr:hypothetical protein [Nonomuraea terrae]TDD45645.1 hypothetical protein E1286_23475 [Nonomuraea terrae]